MKRQKAGNTKRKIVITEPIHNIIHISFPTQHLMCSTLLRFQEYYESPKFKGKMFTLEEYMDYYAEKHGAFTYFQDYGGFNFPAKVLGCFRLANGKDRIPLTKKESQILNVFSQFSFDFHWYGYIIGTARDSDTQVEDFVHELAHGLYYTNKQYRKNVRAILKDKKLEDSILEQEYRKENLIDETQAILIDHESKNNKRVRNKLVQNFKAFTTCLDSFVLLETVLQ